ncbi:hypothetical protein K435DRAFT_743906 [Dendrothele bispora CBS 962.96]|uniref:BTB domain-containing protein n=2 Tax=Dendrothele bispora (strain CBS 962.96) TaxID=1314807 RepID=A0A4S8MSP0_DENBC|nr:hypothetical protein K435DRAFT_743906 [Dendrothele bispora CBS 962.96]
MHSDHDSDSIVEVSHPSPSTACENSTNKGILRSTHFYFNNVIFQVEDTLYNVPCQPFMRESDVFHDLFSLPVLVGRKSEGQSDEEPVLLQSVSKVDFERLLSLLFPDAGIDAIPTTEEWLSILKLATLWDMPKIRERAIMHMAPLLSQDPVQKIEIAREYDIDDWMLPALNQLVQRDQPLTVDEGERLGMEYTTKLASIRECCRFNNRTFRWELGRSRRMYGIEFR